jgi:Zn-dependent protease with chaperone function
MIHRIVRVGLTVIAVVVVVCVVLSMVHRWHFLFNTMVMLCCLPYFSRLHQYLSSSFAYTVPILSIAILLLGSLSLLWRLWRTYQYGLVLQQWVIPTSPPRLITISRNPLILGTRVSVVHDQAPFACCFGLIRPRIYLSTGLLTRLSDNELEAVLLHEVYHCRRYDPLRTLIMDVIATMFFFLPILGEWCRWQRTHAELQADRFAIQLRGRRPLAGALYKLLTHAPEASARNRTTAVGFSATEMRLAHLLTNTPIRWQMPVAPLLTSTLVLLLICFVA